MGTNSARLTAISRGIVLRAVSGPQRRVPIIIYVAFGSWLCKNADTETDCATMESRRCRGRIIVAAKANFLIQCFVSVCRKLFLHSLGHNRSWRASSRMSVAGGTADENTKKRTYLLVGSPERGFPFPPAMAPCAHARPHHRSVPARHLSPAWTWVNACPVRYV